jgi:peroxiredoxin
MSAADPSFALLEKYRDLDAPLSERLAAYSDAHRRLFPAYSQAVDKLVERLKEADGWQNAPGVGGEMPPFLLPDHTGHLVSLDELRSSGPVAVMFHRGHWCPYCVLNLHAIAARSTEIGAAGGQVVVVMPERQQFAGDLVAETGGRFPILTDLDNAYALSLNLAIWLGPDIIRLVSRSGYDLPKYHGNDGWMVPIPATFVVGPDRRVKARFIDPDFRNRMELDDLLAALRRASA